MPNCIYCETREEEWYSNGSPRELDGVIVNGVYYCKNCSFKNQVIVLRTIVENREKVKQIIDYTLLEIVDDLVNTVPNLVSHYFYRDGVFCITIDVVSVSLALDEFIKSNKINLKVDIEEIPIKNQLIRLIIGCYS